MNFFAQELESLIGKAPAFKSTKCSYIDQFCFIALSDGRRAKIFFSTCDTHEKYEALTIAILNKAEGEIYSVRLRFADYFSTKPDSCVGTYAPHIRVYQGEAKWCDGAPLPADVEVLVTVVHAYVLLFS